MRARCAARRAEARPAGGPAGAPAAGAAARRRRRRQRPDRARPLLSRGHAGRAGRRAERARALRHGAVRLPVVLHPRPGGDAARSTASAGRRPSSTRFIDAELARLGLGEDRLILCGFSQGAMMALHVGLRRPRPVAALISHSGMLIGPEHLAGEIRSRPPVLLTHGADDDVVPAAALPAAKAALEAEGVPRAQPARAGPRPRHRRDDGARRARLRRRRRPPGGRLTTTSCGSASTNLHAGGVCQRLVTWCIVRRAS